MGVLLSIIVHVSKQAMTLDRTETPNLFCFDVETLHKSDITPLTIAIPVNAKLTEEA